MIAWAIEAIVASALLMLLVLLLRRPVREMFGPSVAYALWALPAVRLLLPPLPSGWRDAAAAPIAKASEGITVMVVEPLGLAPAPAASLVHAAAPAGQSPSLALLLLAFWLAGAGSFLVWHMVAHARFCRRVLTRARKIVRGPVNVVETDAATGPLAFGIVRKYVAFPGDFQDRYDADERDLALEHELTHHARGDLIANWIALFVLAVHWFNPLAWRAFRAFRADQEMACDARVLAGRDPAFRHAYGRAIVKSAHGGAVSAACHLHTINDLKGRLKMLSMGRKSRSRVLGGAVSVAAITLGALGLTASGTQAAERLRTKVSHTIGVDIANLDAAALATPLASVASGNLGGQVPPAPPEAPAAPQVPQAVAVPPSAVAPEALAAPIAQAAADMPAQPEPPAPPAAADPAAPGTRVERHVEVVTTDDGKSHRRIRIVHRDKDGKVLTDDIRELPEIPQISSADCPENGDPRQTVIKGEKNGKRFVIICQNRIEKLAINAQRDAERVMINSKDIERRAYMSALTSLRSARATVSNPDAIRGIDDAIAEMEQNLSKID